MPRLVVVAASASASAAAALLVRRAMLAAPGVVVVIGAMAHVVAMRAATQAEEGGAATTEAATMELMLSSQVGVRCHRHRRRTALEVRILAVAKLEVGTRRERAAKQVRATMRVAAAKSATAVELKAA